jgi:AhpD family alkylhydroperoxidase
MNVDGRTASLIAVGASVTANCQPCLEINAARAMKHGAGPAEIGDAVEIGRKVRAGAAAKLDAMAGNLGAGPEPDHPAPDPCPCGP